MTFNVKNDSIHEFFSQHLLGKYENNYDPGSLRNTSPYHLMQDTILLKKSDLFKPDTVVTFSLMDVGKGSGRSLINAYEYVAVEYDDVSVILRLTNFAVYLK